MKLTELEKTEREQAALLARLRQEKNSIPAGLKDLESKLSDVIAADGDTAEIDAKIAKLQSRSRVLPEAIRKADSRHVETHNALEQARAKAKTAELEKIVQEISPAFQKAAKAIEELKTAVSALEERHAEPFRIVHVSDSGRIGLDNLIAALRHAPESVKAEEVGRINTMAMHRMKKAPEEQQERTYSRLTIGDVLGA